jgi:hypothetical protein
VLYAGVAAFIVLAAFTARSAWIAWRDRSGEATAEALFSLVEQRTPARPTEAPGALAWLRLQLEQYERHIDNPDRASLYRSFAAAGDRVPDVIRPIADVMRTAAAAAPSAPSTRVKAAAASTAAPSSLRAERLIAIDAHWLALTRRRALDAPDLAADTASNAFVRDAAVRLDDARQAIDARLGAAPLPGVPGDEPPRPVRIYAVSEDGTLLSDPWDGPVASDAGARHELTLLATRPALPSFAPEDFFFRFDPAALPATQANYSGFYLDLGGRGLVSTVTMPFVAAGGSRAILALDLAFAIDWHALAATVDPPIVGTSATLDDAGSATWTSLERALGTDAAPSLRTAVATLASRERQTGAPAEPSPLRHGLVDATGAVAAFQVTGTSWLLMWFPKTSPAFPIAAVTLLTGLLALLFVGFEYHRRRAEDERHIAERALDEKQNLLNTMQVPLVVVDPNTDVIVSSNLAAEHLGIRTGSRFADLVWPDARARAHYERMQVATPEPRRAYGLPVAVRDASGEIVERYAVVRSVAVTAPIEALAADERHRLGVLFLLDPDADLALLADDLSRAAHRDERQRLSGLLSHGVDTLARVLEHCLSQKRSTAGMADFTAWLAEYLERRLTVTGWLLDRWDATPPLPNTTVVTAEQARETIRRLSSVLALVRDDRDLRARLHWDNGTLSAPSASGVLSTEIEWPDEFEFACPVRGGFGMFLGEVVANAVRHGTPGTTPTVSLTCDRIRKELVCVVENEASATGGARLDGEAYGGVQILRALARLFEWRDLSLDAQEGRVRARWRTSLSERPPAGQAD